MCSINDLQSEVRSKIPMFPFCSRLWVPKVPILLLKKRVVRYGFKLCIKILSFLLHMRGSSIPVLRLIPLLEPEFLGVKSLILSVFINVMSTLWSKFLFRITPPVSPLLIKPVSSNLFRNSLSPWQLWYWTSVYIYTLSHPSSGEVLTFVFCSSETWCCRYLLPDPSSFLKSFTTTDISPYSPP